MNCFKKIVLYFLLIYFSASLPAQNKFGSSAPSKSSYIYSYTIDPANNILYYAGNSAVGSIGALNSLTGINLNWGPAMSGMDEVGNILFSDGIIYINGIFSSVKGNSRANIAALDKNGNVTPWAPVNIVQPTGMDADNNYLYVGQLTNTTVTVISKATGKIINDSIAVDDAWSAVLKIAYKDSFIFALTEFELVVYKMQYNSFQEPTALKIIDRKDLSSYGYYYFPQGYFNYGAPELVLFNDEIAVMFDFIYNGKQSAFVKFKWDPVNYQLTKQNYDVDVWSTCPSSFIYLDIPDYIIKPKMGGATFYDSTLYIGGYYLSDLAMDSCGNPYALLSSSPFISNTSQAFKGNLLFGPDYYDMRQLKGINNLLYQVSTRQLSDGNVNYTMDYISAHCLTPMRPGKLTIYKKDVCPEENGVKYELQNVPGTTYTWTYSGKGAKINSTGTNSITIDFSLTPTPGELSVIATSACGLKSTPRSFYININSPPFANAGADLKITCAKTSVTLLGSSTTSGVIYNWKKPDGTTTTNAQPTVSKTGQYILTVTEMTKGCHWRDTAYVTIDTLKPKVFIPTGNYILTCGVMMIDIDGSVPGSTDSLQWINSGGATLKNPLKVIAAGKYKLIVLNRKNGCSAKDSVAVSSNTTPPKVATPFTSMDLTCKNDTLTLNGSSSTPNTIIKWIGAGDTLPNSATITKAGVYLISVTDTINGCKATKAVTINYKQYKPAITTSGDKTITCSSPSVSLDGSSSSTNTTLSWSGPGGYISTNPAGVTKTGVYTFTVTDTASGCVSDQKVNVDSKLSLALSVSSDTTICPGSSVTLSAIPLGGSPGYSYTWMNKGAIIGNASTQLVSPKDTMLYTVTISDNNGCVGIDSVYVFVPDPIISSITAFQSCDPNNANGQLQVLASNGVAPYTYSINGNLFQSSAIFPNLTLGPYTVTTKDALGCIHVTTTEITSSSLVPTVDFLVSTNNMKGDTFVIVDISNPRPDKIKWELPAGAMLLDSNSLAPTIAYDKTGSFTIIMNAYYGTCIMKLTKTIYFTPFDSTYINANNNNGIEQLSIYPNPNNGTFNIELKFYVKQIFVLQVFTASGIESYKQVIPSSTYYFGSITIPQAENGTYILKVTAEHDSKQRSIIVTK